MKKIMILKTLVDIVWIICSIGVGLWFLALIISLFTGEPSYKYGIFDVDFGSNDASYESLLIYPLLLVNLFLFRRISYYFLRNRTFDNKVISNMNVIGLLFIICGFSYIIIPFLTHLIRDSYLGFQISIFDNTLIYFITGLFFMVLSEIFKISKAQKEENELTI